LIGIGIQLTLEARASQMNLLPNSWIHFVRASDWAMLKKHLIFPTATCGWSGTQAVELRSEESILPSQISATQKKNVDFFIVWSW
jgi:hypothetical protein